MKSDQDKKKIPEHYPPKTDKVTVKVVSKMYITEH